MSIVLVGPPASGKTTVGSRLAQALGWECVDVDKLIEQRAAKTIGEIFADDGEPHFRRLERDTTLEVLGGDRVVSLGGGAVMDDQVRAALCSFLPDQAREHEVVWLQVSVTHATRRVGMNVMRPLVLGDVRANLERLQREREHLYREVATVTIDTTQARPHEIVEQLVARR